MSSATTRRIWYVAYASNLASDRFRCYLGGGPVPGGHRVYPGCRSSEEPRATARLELRGGLVFAGRSTVWGGGIAVHDPRPTGGVAGRGYLLTCDQAADVVAQETRQAPGGPWARYAEQELAVGARSIGTSGTTLYDTLLRLGEHDGAPVFTITHRDVASLTPATPSAPYLRWVVTGLIETYGWDVDRVAQYLADVPGVGGGWSRAAIVELVGRSPE